ncbi:hypothetical protein NQZ68_028721 [Dissostichus eleginoides]|nr:hypothetical protein NQZ68_028721 [Dissostichus eleginoides]
MPEDYPIFLNIIKDLSQLLLITWTRLIRGLIKPQSDSSNEMTESNRTPLLPSTEVCLYTYRGGTS